MQILISVAGSSPFFPENDNYVPKSLIEVVGKPMIERVVSALRVRIRHPRFFFAVLQQQARQHSIDKTLRILGGPETRIIEKLGETKGALCSCLLAIDEIDPDAPLVIFSSDQIIDVELDDIISKFRSQDAAAGVITFRSVHPRWCYVEPAANNRVARAVERTVGSDIAIAGFYYFRTAGLFFEAAQRAILNDDHVRGVFYISAALNQIILQGNEVVYEPIDAARYYRFYSPDKIKEFGETAYAAQLRANCTINEPVNVIIPAAGEGSKFRNVGWRKPKPFIDINGRAMLEHVIDNVVPDGFAPTVLLRREHMKACSDDVEVLRKTGCAIQEVDEMTEGAACTVLIARDIYDNDFPMIVANSDQWVEFDCREFVEDCLSRNLDGSILVFRDKDRDPKWSFAKVDHAGLVTEVAEKNPISDLATAGIYLFRRGSDFVRSAVDMIARNDRVRNEFYTCPVYNHMIRSGLRIGVYEVPPEAMNGLGTPEDLNAYLKAIGASPSADAPLGNRADVQVFEGRAQ